MDSVYTYVLISFVIGSLISWLLLKIKFSSKINEAENNLKAEQTLHTDTKIRLAQVISEKENVEIQLSSANTDKAVAVANMESANQNSQQLKIDIENYKTQIETIRIENNSIGKTFAKAETELSEASKFIKELQQRESEVKNEKEFLQRQLTEVKEENSSLNAKYKETIKRLEEQQQFVNDSNIKLKEAFSTLSANALRENNESFVTLAKATLEAQVSEAKGDFEKKEQAIGQLVKPLSESLTKFDNKITELENARLQQHGQINQFISGLQQSTEKLQKETGNLVTALKTSRVRGRYGEIALKRLVEFASMNDHCDFEEQVNLTTEDGRLRPDMVIKLPGNKTLVVDAKIPLDSYLSAFETTDEDERTRLLKLHAVAVRQHLKKLSEKSYWHQFSNSPDYVIMYLQIESSFGACLEIDRTLIEDGINNRVILATPTTLITLLRTVSFSWQQMSIIENIEEIRLAGVELFNRTNSLLGHFNAIGSGLKSAVTNYNNAVGSLESRFIPSAKKMKELGGSSFKEEVADLKSIEISVRPLNERIENKIGTGNTSEEEI